MQRSVLIVHHLRPRRHFDSNSLGLFCVSRFSVLFIYRYVDLQGRHKRNATFPGGQPNSLMQNGTAIRSELFFLIKYFRCCYLYGNFSDGGGSASRPRHNSCHAGGWSTTPRAQSTESTPQSQQPTQPLATPETKGKPLIIYFILNIKYQHVSPLTSRITAFDNMQSRVYRSLRHDEKKASATYKENSDTLRDNRCADSALLNIFFLYRRVI